MEKHELQDELTETVDQMSTDQAKLVQEKYPSLSDEDAASAARLQIGLQVIMPGADEKKVAEAHNALIEALSRTGFAWADRYTQAHIATFRPAYDSALAADVAPAPVIAAMGKVSLAEARVIVRAFKKADKEKVDTSDADAVA